MRWEDERYVRLYTRDTVDWEMLPWQSRALFPLLLRKVDRAGIIQLGKHGTRGLSSVVGLPVEVTEPGLAGLLDDGSAELHGDALVIKNFIEAQEATASDSKRAREYRERHRNGITNRDNDVTDCDATVTGNHDASRAVTTRHSVPNLTVLSLALSDPPAATAEVAEKPRKVPKPKPKKVRPRWSEAVASYHDAWMALHSLEGKPPVIEGADASALARVYDRHGPDETIALIQRFVSDPDPHIARRGHILRDLDSRVNAYRAKTATTGAASKLNFKEAAKHAAETKDRTHEL